MIAKIIAYGSNRDEALARLHRALSQTTVLVARRDHRTSRSSSTSSSAQRFERATVDTAWLDRLTAADEHLPTRLADVALVAAAIDASELQAALDRATFLSWASRGRPQAETAIGRDDRAAPRRVSPARSPSGTSDRPGTRSSSTA